jgi:hypothetical protein
MHLEMKKGTRTVGGTTLRRRQNGQQGTLLASRMCVHVSVRSTKRRLAG